MSKHLNVVIVGGSLGGLFNGIALSRRGHRVTLLERNPTPLMHDQGAGIVAGSDTQDFFDRYDRTRTSLAVTSHARQYLDKSGDVINLDQRAQKMTSWDLLYHLLRANFDGVKSEYVDPPAKLESDGDVQYRYGHIVTALEDLGTDKGVRVTSKCTTADTDDVSEAVTADLVIAADGASSFVRSTLLPSVQRTYAGYVAWRGTCPESALSPSTAATLVEKFTFFHQTGLQILAYLIPGKAGSREPGQRLMNWVWYCNYAEDGPELAALMTDKDGKRHRVTLPPGGIREDVWAAQRERAERELPPPFAELVRRTEVPFVQAITDVVAPRASLFDGRVLLTGDALAGFRPHTAASTSQAAFDAHMVALLVDGALSVKEWESSVLEYAREVQTQGVMLGQRSQFGSHPLNG